METYTDVTAVADESARIKEVEEEQIQTLNESSFSLPNQEVLSKFSQNGNALQYAFGSYSKQTTAKKEGQTLLQLGNIETDIPGFYLSAHGSRTWALVDSNNIFKENTIIKDILFNFNGQQIGIRDMIKLDMIPYILHMHKTFSYGGELVLAVMQCTSSDNTIINALNNLSIPSITVIYEVP